MYTMYAIYIRYITIYALQYNIHIRKLKPKAATCRPRTPKFRPPELRGSGLN